MTAADRSVRGVMAYIVLAFGLAWIPWSLAWLAGITPARLAAFQLAVLPGSFAPAIAALLVRAWITREGFDDAGLRVNLYKWRGYLFALISPLIISTIIVVLATTLGVSTPDFSVQRALHALGVNQAPPPRMWLVLPFGLLFQSVLVTPILWGEEFGWRGYLQLRVCRNRPLLAAIATGLIWGIWHYPLIGMGYEYPDHPMLGLLIFPVSTVLLSIVFGWLRLTTGSVWAASLAHAATNATGGSLLLLLFWGGPHWWLVSYVGVLGWLPLGTICAWIVYRRKLFHVSGGLTPPTPHVKKSRNC